MGRHCPDIVRTSTTVHLLQKRNSTNVCRPTTEVEAKIMKALMFSMLLVLLITELEKIAGAPVADETGLMNAENGALEGWEEMKNLAGEDRTGEEQQAARMDRGECIYCGLMNAENGALEGWEEMKNLAGEDRTGEEQQAARMDRGECIY